MPAPYDPRYRPQPGQPRQRYDWAEDEPTDRFPHLLDRAALSGLPIPIQVVVTGAILPFELAVTSVNILRNTEALLGELVFHLRALRPAVAAASQAYADGHFDPVFKTFGQIQQGTDAIAFVWAPLTAVRDVIVPGQGKREITVGPPTRVPPPAPVVPVVPAPPTTVEWLGGIGGRMLDQAETLPGGGLFTRSLRRFGQVAVGLPETGPDPIIEVELVPDFDLDDEEPERPPARTPDLSILLPVIERAGPLVPGPVRRLFGGN
ncbi:MAG: hypothetical protein QOD04_5609 [Pseudonocardiales bacterium]|nr:hypothetical protein [Pseudonocardiales bacterium]